MYKICICPAILGMLNVEVGVVCSISITRILIIKKVRATFIYIYKKIPHTGNTRPSCTCVIQEYQFYTISLSKYHGCCQYHKSMSIRDKNDPIARPSTLNHGPWFASTHFSAFRRQDRYISIWALKETRQLITLLSQSLRHTRLNTTPNSWRGTEQIS